MIETHTQVTNEELAEFCKRLDLQQQRHYTKFCPGQTIPVHLYMTGKRFARIVRDDGVSRSAVVFVEMSNGDIWKPAGWKAPTLNFSRGNIRDEHGGMKQITPYGVERL